MGREAMQEDGFRVRELHQIRVHRVAPERVAPRLRLLLLPHRRPHVRVHHVRALHRVFGGLRDGDAGAPPPPPPPPRPPPHPRGPPPPPPAPGAGPLPPP